MSLPAWYVVTKSVMPRRSSSSGSPREWTERNGDSAGAGAEGDGSRGREAAHIPVGKQPKRLVVVVDVPR